MAMIRIGRLSLGIPEGWRDASTYVITGPEVNGFIPSVVVSAGKGHADQTPRDSDKFAKAELEKMKQGLHGFSLLEEATVKMGGRGAHRVDFSWVSGDGLVLRQTQVYLTIDGVGHIVTITSTESHYADMKPLVQRILGSIAVT
jgi:hypothetical protein